MLANKLSTFLDRILGIISRHPFIFVLLGYLAVNVWFNYNIFWHELVFDRSQIGAVYGEVRASEWGTEKIYQKILNGENPFTSLDETLYPFGLDIVGAGGGYAFEFLLFRPFLSVHQSYSMVTALNLLLANIGMYLLLRSLGIRKLISFLIGLAFGYMTFLTPRLGHPDFSTYYLLAWFFLSVLTFIQSKRRLVRVLSTLGATFFFVFSLWNNIYYFTIILISSAFLSAYLLLTKRSKVFKFLRARWRYSLLGVATTILLLVPWLKALYANFLFGEPPRPQGWGGAIEFSSDLFGFFVPSVHNYYYGHLVMRASQHIKFMQGIFENFTYPGLIIILSYLILFFFYKKIPTKLKENLKPYLLVSFIFLILTLGPFLHVFGRWWIELEEGIRIVVPLPFAVLHYLPFFGNLRAPGRFSVGFIFFAYIVTAMLITNFLRSRSVNFKLAVFSLFLLVFVIDQRYTDRGGATPSFHPERLFKEIQQDPAQVSVLKIPFSVRDGFSYFGDYNSILVAEGQLAHNKPVVGGYAGRIPSYIKSYYHWNPFLGYLGRIMDPNPAATSLIYREDLTGWLRPNLEKSAASLDFLDLKYVILDNEQPYSATVSALLVELGFAEQKSERNYLLWNREPQKKEFLSVTMAGEDDKLFLGVGWYPAEEDFRWADRRSSVMFKVVEPRRLHLNFRAAAFHQSQAVDIYLNREKAATAEISTEMQDYRIPLDKTFKSGINTIHFIFPKGYFPAEVIPGSLDERRLAAKFTKIFLTDQ